MNEILEQIADGRQFYHARSSEYASNDVLPFRISPEPFAISVEEGAIIERIGNDISSFMFATAELYANDDTVKEILDRGKPEVFCNNLSPDYLFWRPDLIVTSDGFTICEIETSVFGLALAELLNRGYSQAGFETMVEPKALSNHVGANTSPEGEVVYTDKTKAFRGQLEFLAKHVFSEGDRVWQASHVNESQKAKPIYRAHYLSEYLSDIAVKNLYDDPDPSDQTMPSLTPQFEEKAIMAFLWDSRFEDYYRKALGDSSFGFLRTVIPPTWIVGEEARFAPGLPNSFQDSAQLANLPRSKRAFVLKSSGFAGNCSWSDGVHFLQEKSQKDSLELLTDASLSPHLHVVQEFKPGIKREMRYQTPEGSVDMAARVRLTPYFSAVGTLVAMKATGCEGTQRIHASTASINTAVSIK